MVSFLATAHLAVVFKQPARKLLAAPGTATSSPLLEVANFTRKRHAQLLFAKIKQDEGNSMVAEPLANVSKVASLSSYTADLDITSNKPNFVFAYIRLKTRLQCRCTEKIN